MAAFLVRARVAVAALALSLPAIAAPIVERVSFPSLDLDPRTGNALVLNGIMFRPPAAETRRVPAVIALHGCAGLYSTQRQARERLTLRHRAMAELATAEGVAVLFPDSFRSRGREEICSLRAPQDVLNQRHRRLDALAALAWLQAREDIAADRIVLLGWSHGGVTLLATLNDRDPQVRAYRASTDAPYFRAGIAFYPGCIAALNGRIGFAPAAPLTLLIAGSDDWTAPGPCIRLAERMRAAGERVDHVVYPDALHGFDGPDSMPRTHFDYPNGVRPGQGVTVAVDPAAREDAYRRVRAQLRELIQP